MQWATGVIAGTIVAGTLVAEIDAGKEFNTFPKMGDHWIPGGLFELMVSASTPP
jgi:cytochrome c oxidase assembly protein subunit 15